MHAARPAPPSIMLRPCLAPLPHTSSQVRTREEMAAEAAELRTLFK